jgi:hypothetical protein
MTEAGRIAEATVCDSRGCYSSHFLVRGTRIEFLSTEALKKSGAKRETKNDLVYWSPRMPAADVKLRSDYVLVHDTVGRLLSKCDLYVVRWRRKGSKEIAKDILEDAREYFVNGDNRQLPLSYGSVEIPEGPWHREARVALIRYRRPGFSRPFEHAYDPPVDMYYCESPLAWRLPLPSGCVVDSHGFRWP